MNNSKLLTISRNVFQLIINILLVIIALLLLVAIYNFYNLKVQKKDYVSYFGYTTFNITSGSMEPTIHVDDYVFVKINNKKIKKGDIITFKNNNNIITHRVVKIDNDTITTKGDSNNVNDEPIKRKEIIGKVVHIGHEYGVYLKVIKTPQVFITFFISIILMDIALGEDKEVSKIAKKKE